MPMIVVTSVPAISVVMPMPAVRIGVPIIHIGNVVDVCGDAVEIGAIGVACDVAQTAMETTAVTAIAIGNGFMLSSLDKYLLPNRIVLLRR
jgi:hypothetical protein